MEGLHKEGSRWPSWFSRFPPVAVIVVVAGCTPPALLASSSSANSAEVAPEPARPLTVAAAASAPASAAAPLASSPPVVAVDEITIEPLVRVACELRAPSWGGSLQLRAGGPPFALVNGVPATMSLPQSTGPGRVTVDGGLTLRGVIGTPRIFLANPVVLAGIVAPAASTKLGWEGLGRAGRVAVTLDVSGVFVAPTVLRQEIDCHRLAISPSDYDVRAFAKAGGGTPGGLAGDIPLSITVGGQPVATLSGSPGGTVTAGPTRGGMRRVVVETSEYIAFGWVSESFVTTRIVGHGTRGGEGFLRPPQPTAPPSQCKHPLTLLAQVDGARAVVGSLKAGQRFRGEVPAGKEPQDPEGFLAIDIVDIQWLTRAPGAHLLLKKSELGDCE